MDLSKQIFISTCIFLSFACLSQEDSEEKKLFSFAGRAKILGFVIIEDEWIRSFSIGGELIFKDEFSLVADIVHLRYKHEREVPKTQGDYSNYDEYWQKDARNYLAFELRYFPKFVQFENVRYYLNTYSKVGGRFLHTQDLYPLEENEIERLNSNFHDFGSSIGAKIGDPFGIDVNIGAAYRNELKNEDRYHMDGSTTYHSNVNDARWLPNIRVSFFLHL